MKVKCKITFYTQHFIRYVNTAVCALMYACLRACGSECDRRGGEVILQPPDNHLGTEIRVQVMKL